MNRGVLLPLVGSLALLLGSGLGWAGQYDEKERAELAQALKGAKVSLKQGIIASAPKGDLAPTIQERGRPDVSHSGHCGPIEEALLSAAGGGKVATWPSHGIPRSDSSA